MGPLAALALECNPEGAPPRGALRMSEADEVADFLLSTESYVVFALGRLEFSLDGFRVDREGYREIGHKIKQGAVAVVPVQSASGSRVAAVYTPRRDRLSVPAGLDLHTPGAARIGNQAMIVHECTHALIDFHRFTCSGAVNEACGYIAGQLYAMTLGLRQTGAGAESRAIIATAQAVVTGRRMTGTTGVQLRSTDRDVAALVAAVTAHTSAYPDARVVRTPDGISGGLINPWYQPRH
jgi:hypothetical protein